MRLQEAYLFNDKRRGVENGSGRSTAGRLYCNRAAARFSLLARFLCAGVNEQLRAITAGIEISALQRAAKDLPWLVSSFANIENVDVLRWAIGILSADQGNLCVIQPFARRVGGRVRRAAGGQ